MSAPKNVAQVQGQGSVTADNLNTYVQWCTTAAVLRTFVGLPNMCVYLEGISAPNDGLQGFFEWQAVVLTPDDNLNYIIPTGAAGGGWVRLFIGGNALLAPNSGNVVGDIVVMSNTTTGITDSGFYLAVRTRQVLTAGTAATYTTPAHCKQLFVRYVGGGAGGGGAGHSTAGAGANGSNTSFNSIVANGGSAGPFAAYPGAGGTGGTGTASVRSPGGPGVVGVDAQYVSGFLGTAFGGSGGSSLLGGGAAATASTGVAAAANSGGGGSGGSYNNGDTGNGGGGGGSGEYVELIINSPAATYVYTVGPGGVGGTAGTTGNVGGAGGSGIIIVDEYYT